MRSLRQITMNLYRRTPCEPRVSALLEVKSNSSSHKELITALSVVNTALLLVYARGTMGWLPYLLLHTPLPLLRRCSTGRRSMHSTKTTRHTVLLPLLTILLLLARDQSSIHYRQPHGKHRGEISSRYHWLEHDYYILLHCQRMDTLYTPASSTYRQNR